MQLIITFAGMMLITFFIMYMITVSLSLLFKNTGTTASGNSL
ncbi:MAG: hypothetical protein SOY47_10150 [Lachnospiraceae bacterium]|nr:hypothetical protein [Lachnospiraceae bacterium]